MVAVEAVVAVAIQLIVDSEGVQDSASIVFVDATASSSLEVFDGALTFLKDSFDAASKLIVIYCNSEISLNFCEDCRIFREGEWEVEVNGEVKVNELTESDEHLIDQVLTEHRPSIIKPHVNKRQRVEERSGIDGRPSIDGRSRVDESLCIDERSSFKIPCVIEKPPVDERPRVGKKPRVEPKLTRPNCTQIVQYTVVFTSLSKE
jgi:hypothetical protein